MNYLNEKMCRDCGGTCCKRIPGIAHPEDFLPNLEHRLQAALFSKMWAVDWYENFDDGDGYYIRPAVVGARGPYDPAWGGRCIFLAKNGCELSADHRPYGCRMLEPNLHFTGRVDCLQHVDGNEHYQAAVAWAPFSEIIKKIADSISSWGPE